MPAPLAVAWRMRQAVGWAWSGVGASGGGVGGVEGGGGGLWGGGGDGEQARQDGEGRGDLLGKEGQGCLVDCKGCATWREVWRSRTAVLLGDNRQKKTRFCAGSNDR